MKSKSYLSALVVLALGGTIVASILGCQSGPPSGTLQVFYSGNLTGSMEPCG
jgi:hypothetical protein